MKAFGIEDLWGNLACFLDGVRVGDSGSFLVATNSFALEEAWRDTGRQCMEAMGYILQVHGDNELGFLAQEIGAGATTGWAAYGGAGAGLLSLVGGHHSSRQQSGAFQHTITTVQDFSTPGITGRLMYL